MDIERAFVVVQDHSEEEVRQVLAAFEKLYSGQFPNLNLQQLGYKHLYLVDKSST